MRQRALYLLRFYLATLLFFVVGKVGFMLYHHGGHDFSLSDMMQVIGHGLSLDLSTSFYIFILPFLLTIISLWVRVPRWVYRVYYVIAAVLLALAFVADTSLYEFWLFKLDASCLQYLETPTEAMASVSVWYVLLRILSFLLIAFLIYWVYDKLTSYLLPLTSYLSKLIATLVALLLIPFIIIGIRGGLDESTTNIGQVYFSQNQFLNHSAVNPFFSFFASFEKTASNNVTYHFMEDAECEKIVSELYNTQSMGIDTLLSTQQPNIIVILLESCGGQFTEISGRTDITPNLNRLAKEGIYFTNCYGNSWRTDRGTLCTWSGYPSFPTMSVMKIPSKSRTMPNIARTLQEERGYHTHYLYGGDINFTNMRSYLVSGGFSNLTWKEDYTSDEQKSAKWGVRDDITFETLYQLTTTMPQPYLIGYSTLSSHSPWDVPIHHFDDEVLNAFYYLDQCVGNFIERLRKSPAWDNTLVVMLPDHGIFYQDIDESNPLLNHIPMIWVGGAVKEPRRVEQICNQTDLPATLLGQLGLNHDAYTFSRDVLSKTYTRPVAIHTYDDGFTMIDSTSFVNYDFISDRVVRSEGNGCERLIRQAQAILQAATKDLNER
ncbi:LTA synthase family protein [Prevotella sp. tf2-5]|uniref:LTA synthase family protein n=1 Tax=Prevotella sp. tf2-5 TaxID=1761889 RepID=UPI0008F1E62D|nr:LTA synthase family protein [Prevotella sp. tf2-5]SFO67914.1 Phosphoglycerol transferase MdoB [Prevotella sp. tf2-5]